MNGQNFTIYMCTNQYLFLNNSLITVSENLHYQKFALYNYFICNDLFCALLRRFFDRLVDCAIFFNSRSTESSGSTPAHVAMATLLLSRETVSALEGTSSHHYRRGRAVKQPAVQPEIIDLATSARQHGVEVDTLLRLHKRWQSHSKREQR